MPHKPHPTYYLLLPAAACYCLLLPATACYYLLLPATPCYFLLLPATYYLLPAPCCCLLLQVRGRLHLEGKHVNFDTLLRETSAVRGCGRPACCCLMLRAVRGVDSLPAHMRNMDYVRNFKGREERLIITIAACLACRWGVAS